MPLKGAILASRTSKEKERKRERQRSGLGSIPYQRVAKEGSVLCEKEETLMRGAKESVGIQMDIDVMTTMQNVGTNLNAASRRYK